MHLCAKRAWDDRDEGDDDWLHQCQIQIRGTLSPSWRSPTEREKGNLG